MGALRNPNAGAGRQLTDHAALLFDGVCNFCNRSVQFIIARDPEARFQFAALGSDAAHRLLSQSGVNGPLPDSIVLIEGTRVFTRSSAALRIARGLRFPWPLLSVFAVVPRPVRDWLYDYFASHRYRWFGRRESCMIPTPDIRKRFLT